jgi:hypothetical protein
VEKTNMKKANDIKVEKKYMRQKIKRWRRKKNV